MRKSFLIGSALLASAVCGSAVQGLRLSIQNDTDVVLRWPSSPGQRFLIAYRPDLQPGTQWAFLDTAYAAALTGGETTYTDANVVVYPPPAQGGGTGGGGPPTPGISSMTASSVWMPWWDQWMYEGRQPYLHEIERRPPCPWDRDVCLMRGKDLLSVDSSTRAASTQSESALPPIGAMGFYFVTEYEDDLDGDRLPNGFELTLGTSILAPDSDGDTIDDAREDFDGDGSVNFEEYLAATDPVVSDNVTPTPLADGLVLSGEQIINFPADGVNREGVLCFPDGNLTDAMAVDEPSADILRIRWHSTFIHYGVVAVGAGDPPPPPHFEFTAEDRRLINEAFPGGGTSTSRGHVQTVNMAAVDQMRPELLEHLEQTADRRTKIAFQNIQKWNADPSIPLDELQRRTQIEIDQVHTQFTRGGAANSSLWRRFGRALNRSLPYFGAILILANAPNFAEQFNVSLQDYARDIRNGDDETGSAAVTSGYCNDLSPGSGNIVLNYLLR